MIRTLVHIREKKFPKLRSAGSANLRSKGNPAPRFEESGVPLIYKQIAAAKENDSLARTDTHELLGHISPAPGILPNPQRCRPAATPGPSDAGRILSIDSRSGRPS